MGSENIFCRLSKCLYSIKQSARREFIIAQILHNFFSSTKADPSLLTLTKGDENILLKFYEKYM